MLKLYETSDMKAGPRLLAHGARSIAQFSDRRRTWKGLAGLLALGIVLIGTFVYPLAFTHLYNRPMTRIAGLQMDTGEHPWATQFER